jgi:tetratricopeptide (TPR) repeat protein
MAKVIQFPLSGPEKFGFKPVRKQSEQIGKKKSHQLNLFTGAKVVSISKLSQFEEALMLDEQGDASAKEAYQRAIDKGDSSADAYCNLGILESQTGNYTKAIDCFTKSLSENPRHFEAHYNLANVYAEVGNLPLAKIHYQVSIEIEPAFPNSYFNLALTLAMKKEIEEAIQNLHTYIRLVPASEQLQAAQLLASLESTLGK